MRRAVTHGWGYDFNYTFSHALDNGSASETSGGAALQDAFNPNAFRGPSDFDARHTISANAVVEIPVGKGKALLGHIPGWLDYMIGGWQASTLYTFRTGLPLNCTDSGVYNVNYDNSAYCIVKPGSSLPANGFTFDNTGIPSIFANPNVVNSVVASNPGQVGTRGMFRGPRLWTDDISISKSLQAPQRRAPHSDPRRSLQRVQPRKLRQPQPEHGESHHVRRNHQFRRRERCHQHHHRHSQHQLHHSQ